MSEFVSPFLQWINAHPELAGLATFIISAAESVAIIGTIVPGSVTMTAIGTLAGAGIIPLWTTILWATLGAVVGDGISYWIGHYFKERLRVTWPFKNNPGLLQSGEVFVHKYGVMSVFIGRFVGPVRALVPLVAGMLGMKPIQFTLANIASAIGWAPAYMLPGILLGAASLELPPDIALHLILVVFLIGLFIILCFWLTYKILQLIHYRIDLVQTKTWKFLRKSKLLNRITHLLRHHDHKRKHGQLNLAIYFCIFTALYFALVIYVMIKGAKNLPINNAVFHLFRGIRTPFLDHVMINVTLLGQKQIILPTIIILFLCLLVWKCWRAAFHGLVLGVMAGGSAFVMKHLIQSPRPWGILTNTESFSMPSAHTVLATTFYLGLAFLIAGSVSRFWGWVIYIVSILFVMAVSISRLYLGVHWFTDVLSGWLLSGALLALIIISFERHHEKLKEPLKLFVVTFACIAILTLGFQHWAYKKLQTDYAPLPYPVTSISEQDWWQGKANLPYYYVSLFGFPSQKISIMWAGNLGDIKKNFAQTRMAKSTTARLD